MRFNLIGYPTIVATIFFLGAGSASAHHLMGGKTPSTFAQGLLSGIGHPIIGPDYLAFLLALGIAVGVFRLSFVNPFLFVAAMICGVAVHVAGIYLPAADPRPDARVRRRALQTKVCFSHGTLKIEAPSKKWFAPLVQSK